MLYTGVFYTDALDNWVSKYSGKTLRIYTGAQNGLNVPSGTLLAEFVIPNPSHNAAGFNATANRYEAAMAGTWSDLSADAGGTPASFVIGTVSGGVMTVQASGTARGPANPGADLVLSADTLSAGAPFSVTKFLQFMTLAA